MKVETPKNDGGPAFPVHGGHHPDDDPRNRILGGGMSLRDWFAGQVLASCGAWFTSSSFVAAADREGMSLQEAAARTAYEVADAMMEARSK